MRNLWLLTRILLKSGPGSGNQKSSGKNKGSFGMGQKVLYGILAACCLPVVVMMFFVGKEGFLLLAPAGMEQMLVELLCIAGSMVFFFFGITMFLSVFYLSSDIVRLLPLPLTPVQIVGAKWLCCLLSEYYLVGMFFLPALVGYGVGGGLGIGYWVCMALGCILLPIVPLIYAAVLSMLVMRVFKNIRNKDFLSYLGFAASMIFAVGINFFVQSLNRMEAADIVGMIQGNQGILDTMYAIFPNLVLLVRGIGGSSFLYLFLYVLTCVLFLGVFFWIAWKIYLPGVLGMSESSGEKRRLTGEEVQRTVRQKNPAVTFAWIEWKKLYRTPVYFMNCVLMTLIWPLFMLTILAISLIGSLGTAVLQGWLLELLHMEGLRTVLRGDVAVAVAVLVAAGIAALMSMMCMISSTAISRQGDNFIYLKCIPLSYQKQIQAMLAGGVIVSLIGTLPYALLFNVFAVFFGLHPVTLLYTTAITGLFVLFVNYEQIFVDLLSPKLSWENEAQAVKQNYRAMISMLIDLAVGGALIGIGYFAYRVLHINIHLLTMLLLSVLGVCTWLLRRLLFTRGVEALANLE